MPSSLMSEKRTKVYERKIQFKQFIGILLTLAVVPAFLGGLRMIRDHFGGDKYDFLSPNYMKTPPTLTAQWEAVMLTATVSSVGPAGVPVRPELPTAVPTRSPTPLVIATRPPSSLFGVVVATPVPVGTPSPSPGRGVLP